MVYLVVVLTVLCLVNLLLTVGVVRRLREHTELLAEQAAAPPPPLRPGTRVPGYAELTGATEESVIGFLSPGCEPCRTLLPGFLERAGAAGSSLAVVVGGAERAKEYTDRITGHVEVAVEEMGGPLTSAFQVTVFPTFFVVAPDGTVLGSGNGLTALERPAGAGARP
ncbi:TlpA family protein disulfide reductase [Nonomuraea sp. NPDC050663]|uniref:TlpA family protein disulfide reductase n=1 Tax=Nonomuraea sp. NPDC050663 TaxID=3364370 RepID=UPI00379B4777